MGNIVFEAPPPADWYEEASAMLGDVQVYLDVNAVGPDGRPPASLDLKGVESIRLVKDGRELTAGAVEFLDLDRPPPALIERISGCCFSGRPPGRATAIKQTLARRRVDKTTAVFLQFVDDTATSSRVNESPFLLQAARRANMRDDDTWAEKLATALQAASGASLILLGHVESGRAVVEDARGTELYSISLRELHERARDAHVNLIFFGCNTATESAAQDIPLGLVGEYNTEFAARQIAKALAESTNGLDFIERVAAPGLTFVAQEGNWDTTGVGVTAHYPPPSGFGKALRLFRIWFLGRTTDG
jgi:hypothetical protein